MKIVVTLAVLLIPGTSLATGDVNHGAEVFKKCSACHNADQPQNKIGPNLVGIVGRKAASAEGYNYSEAMKKAGADGTVWTDENIAQYLAAPKKFVPGNKMSFTGLKDQQDIDDLLAYLKSH